MKTFLKIFLIFCITFSITACNNDTNKNGVTPSTTKTTSETPENDKYTINTVSKKINADVPEVQFEIKYLKTDSEDEVELEGLTITQNNKVINEILLSDYAISDEKFLRNISEGDNSIEFIDMNFDGYEDFRIFDRPDGNWNIHYIYFLWDNESEIFIEDKELEMLGLATFNKENQSIDSMERGSAIDHSYYNHKYIDGKLTLLESVDIYAITSIDNKELTSEDINNLMDVNLDENISPILMRSVQKKINYDTMLLEVAEDKLILCSVVDGSVSETIKETTVTEEIEKRLS